MKAVTFRGIPDGSRVKATVEGRLRCTTSTAMVVMENGSFFHAAAFSDIESLPDPIKVGDWVVKPVTVRSHVTGAPIYEGGEAFNVRAIAGDQLWLHNAKSGDVIVPLAGWQVQG